MLIDNKERTAVYLGMYVLLLGTLCTSCGDNNDYTPTNTQSNRPQSVGTTTNSMNIPGNRDTITDTAPVPAEIMPGTPQSSYDVNRMNNINTMPENYLGQNST